jgi:hypothetical protein
MKYAPLLFLPTCMPSGLSLRRPTIKTGAGNRDTCRLAARLVCLRFHWCRWLSVAAEPKRAIA